MSIVFLKNLLDMEEEKKEGNKRERKFGLSRVSETAHIECKGGYCGEIPSRPDEYNGEYPDYYWCDPTMPAYGLYVRHADNISLVNCEFTLLSEDSREAIVFDDCTNVLKN